MTEMLTDCAPCMLGNANFTQYRLSAYLWVIALVQLQHELTQGLRRTNAGSIQLHCVICRVYSASDGPW